VLLRDLLTAAGAREDAGVLLRSFDGAYTESLTAEQARRDDVLVATTMQGTPVSHDHGGPVRLVVAQMYFYKSLKWLGGVEVAAAPPPGYWEVRGYDVDAWVGRSNGRDDAPSEPVDDSDDLVPRFDRVERWAHGAWRCSCSLPCDRRRVCTSPT
jgi:DMSO/TMAO reductase YedYZ molybdopterin-dependent catalytic subunit